MLNDQQQQAVEISIKVRSRSNEALQKALAFG
jgi:hypothetical protein